MVGLIELYLICFFVSPSYEQRERFLRHSDTSPGPVSDWPSPDPAASPTETHAAQDSSASCARPRPRAWSVRTFQDFLPPLPQLHKKWCSWNSTSPFTKLVDSVSSYYVIGHSAVLLNNSSTIIYCISLHLGYLADALTQSD